MPMNTSGIQRGMDVFGSDDAKLGTVMSVNPAADEGGAGGRGEVAPNLGGDLSGGRIDPEPPMRAGTPGTTPLGATTAKGRGDESSAGLVAGRGDIATDGDGEAERKPDAGGANILRGYGMPRRESAGSAAESAAGSMMGSTSTGGAGTPGSLSVTADARVGGMAGRGGDGGMLGSDETFAPRSPLDKPRSSLTSGGEAGGGYLMVQDGGVLGIGAAGLRIPFDIVQEVVAGERVVLSLPRDEVRLRFGSGPSLDIDEHAPITPR